jgi:hypothetical protein
LVERLSHEVETAAAARPKDVVAPNLVSVPPALPLQVQPQPELEIGGRPQGPAAGEIAPVPVPQVAAALEAERAPTPEAGEPATPETAPVEAPSVEPAPSEPAAIEVPAIAESAEVQEVSESPQAPEEQPPAVQQAEPPAGAVSYPELLYVYEIGAEEVVCPETEFPSTSAEEDLEPLAPESLRAPEAAADESLPFEVRSSARGTAAGSADGRSGSGESKEADRARAKPTPSEPPSGQGRLPGI